VPHREECVQQRSRDGRSLLPCCQSYSAPPSMQGETATPGRSLLVRVNRGSATEHRWLAGGGSCRSSGPSGYVVRRRTIANACPGSRHGVVVWEERRGAAVRPMHASAQFFEYRPIRVTNQSYSPSQGCHAAAYDLGSRHGAQRLCVGCAFKMRNAAPSGYGAECD